MNRNKGIQTASIFIAILVLAMLSCQGIGGFNPFATATPTATATFTPSPTPSPTPTLTPTPTPRPTGKAIEQMPDGTTLLTDYDGAYQVTFPEDWTVLNLDKETLDEVLDSIPEQDQDVSKLVETAKNADVNKMLRVFGFNFEAQQGAYTPNITVGYDSNPLLSVISVKDLMDATSAYLTSAGINVSDPEIKETSSGIEIGMLEANWTVNVASGQEISLHQEQIFFKSGEGAVIITYSTVQDATVDLTADIDKIIESIRLLD